MRSEKGKSIIRVEDRRHEKNESPKAMIGVGERLDEIMRMIHVRERGNAHQFC